MKITFDFGEEDYINPYFMPFPLKPFIPVFKTEIKPVFFDYCKDCPCNPLNGGSGICNCTLGQHIIY